MAKQRSLGIDVMDAAYDRLYRLYADGHRLVVCVSGGKDSTVITELAIMAARDAGRLPVEVATRDEEIMLPGTFEYLERLAERTDEVSFHHVIQGMPCVNLFNRENPYWWTFDDLVDPDVWVRKPPPYAYRVPEQHIQLMVTAARFPAEEGKQSFQVKGIRASESPIRTMGIASSARRARQAQDGTERRGKDWDGPQGAHLTKFEISGMRAVRPIYDWTDGDVWRAIGQFGWDYNRAYDVMVKMGVHRLKMRIGPPTQRVSSLDMLQKTHKAWPRWFDRVCTRLPGVRTAVQYGRVAVEPDRRLGETWQQAWHRINVSAEAPAWIRERNLQLAEWFLARHAEHSTGPFPDSANCPGCSDDPKCWKDAVRQFFSGDPMSHRQSVLPYMDPEFFRPGSGGWTTSREIDDLGGLVFPDPSITGAPAQQTIVTAGAVQ